MSSKLGLILSMFFIALFFAFSVDLTSVQYFYSSLENKAITISYKISRHGALDKNFIQDIQNEYHVLFTCLSNCNPQYGDVVNYKISTAFKPLIISAHEMELSLQRSAVVGIYA